MRARGHISGALLAALALLPGAAPAAGGAPTALEQRFDTHREQGQLVDRILARVEDDILTLSELRELERFQLLVEGRAAGREELLRQLLEQWILENEATAARLPRPGAERVEQALERLRERFASEAEYRARLDEVGLTEAAVRRLLERQLYLSGYLDYRFRPAVSIEPEEVEAYYEQELLPELAARGQPPPPLDVVRERIRELLVEREISQRAAAWLEEARARLRVEILEGSEG